MTMAEGVSMADTGYTLVIGDKNYSSWSLRPWLAMKQAGIPFKEECVILRLPESKSEIFRHTPSGKVPALKTDVGVIWDSLAIVEYLAEQHPQAELWPEDRGTRAAARSVSAEMHSSFAALRNDMPMDLLSQIPAPALSDALEANIRRVVAIWMDTRERFGRGGPFLFGACTIADAMYAPVATRFRTYGLDLGRFGDDGTAAAYVDTIYAMPAMEEWAEGARAEMQARA